MQCSELSISLPLVFLHILKRRGLCKCHKLLSQNKQEDFNHFKECENQLQAFLQSGLFLNEKQEKFHYAKSKAPNISKNVFRKHLEMKIIIYL